MSFRNAPPLAEGANVSTAPIPKTISGRVYATSMSLSSRSDDTLDEHVSYIESGYTRQNIGLLRAVTIGVMMQCGIVHAEQGQLPLVRCSHLLIDTALYHTSCAAKRHTGRNKNSAYSGGWSTSCNP